jgi:hypothetical protein
VRGVARTAETLYVLMSKSMSSCQRGAGRRSGGDHKSIGSSPGIFGIAALDPITLEVLALRSISDVRISPGSVAYAAVAWKTALVERASAAVSARLGEFAQALPTN